MTLKAALERGTLTDRERASVVSSYEYACRFIRRDPLYPLRPTSIELRKELRSMGEVGLTVPDVRKLAALSGVLLADSD